jgi:hypothetical protein
LRKPSISTGFTPLFSIISRIIAKFRKKDLHVSRIIVIYSINKNEPGTFLTAMNTSRNENASLDSLSLIAVVTCVLSIAYFCVTSFIA